MTRITPLVRTNSARQPAAGDGESCPPVDAARLRRSTCSETSVIASSGVGVLEGLIANYAVDSVKQLGGVGPAVLFVLTLVGGVACMAWAWCHPARVPAPPKSPRHQALERPGAELPPDVRP